MMGEGERPLAEGSKHMRSRIWVGCAACLVAGSGVALGQDDARESTAITIYSTAGVGAVPAWLYRPTPNGQQYHYNPYQNQSYGYAVVRHDRPLLLPQGRGETQFTGVAALLDPTTVRFESLTDPDGTKVIEQDYRFDLVSQQKLLERYIDKEISVEHAAGNQVDVTTGTLMSTSGGLVLQTRDGLRVINSYSNITFPALPEGLLTRPTLVWDVFSETGGMHETRVSYQTEGITWWADYNLVLHEGQSANDVLLDVGAWVSIVNKTGASYDDARLKLVAGDVHRAPQPGSARGRGAYADAMAAREAGPAGFEEKSFFEYHLYTLGRSTTLPDNATKQLELFEPARGVPAEKVMLYYGLAGWNWRYGPNPVTDRNFGTVSNEKVDVYLRFENDEESGMGIPLPKGRVRVSKQDPADGSLEFIGEDAIDHTPKNEEVLIKLGSAFDVVGERKQTDIQVNMGGHVISESFEIRLRNHKDEAVKVIVKENLYRWVNWELTRRSHEFEKVDSRTIHFPVTVAPDDEVVIEYTVRYTW